MSIYDTNDYRTGYRDGYHFGVTSELRTDPETGSAEYQQGFLDGHADTAATEDDWNEKMESDYHVIGHIDISDLI